MVTSDVLKALKDSGFSRKEVAAALKVSTRRISQVSKEVGISWRKDAKADLVKLLIDNNLLKNENKTAKELADLAGIDESTARQYAKKFKVKLKKERPKIDEEKFLRLFENGMSAADMAAEFGVKRPTIYRWAAKLGLNF